MTKRIKILNIIISKTFGGAEQAFLNYNEALSLLNLDVLSIYNKKNFLKDKLIQKSNIKYLSWYFIKPYFLMLPYYLFKIYQIKPNCIILHSRKILSLFSFIGKILHIPIILVCHSNKTKLIHKANYLFAITNFQKNLFIQNNFPKENIFILPNCIPFFQKEKILEKFQTPICFGAIGRFVPDKNFTTLIESCKILKNKNINFKLIIGGSLDKKYKKEYNKIISLISNYSLENNIHLCGWVKNKSTFYESIDVFILPSLFEPFGIVLLEAMMYSKPIISSKSEGPNEIFQNTDIALMFNASSPKELAELMIKISKNLNLAKNLAENGYELVNKKYTLKAISNLLQNFIEKL